MLTGGAFGNIINVALRLKGKEMSKNVITYLDVNEPIGNVHPGGTTILDGDAPVWKFCNLFHQTIMEGTAVIAIGYGTDVEHHGGDSVIFETEVFDRKGVTMLVLTRKVNEVIRISNGNHRD